MRSAPIFPVNPLLLIPARLRAARLPGKPLADIAGKPMIVRVWERAVQSGLGPVWVACDDAEIAWVVEAAGGNALMTGEHASGSDRIFEALQAIDPEGRHDVIINVQGDMPTLDPAIITEAARLLEDEAVDIGTLTAQITRPRERDDPAVVKAVAAWDSEERRGRALYFTRAAAPYGNGALYHHIGLYAYRRRTLERFVALPPSPLEMREKLEQLRALEAGMRIDVAKVDTVPLGVDTPETLKLAKEHYAAKNL